MLSKTCKKCKETKSLDEFYKNKRYRLGVISLCIPCHLHRTSTWKKQNSDIYRDLQRNWRKRNLTKSDSYQFKYRYGLTLDEFDKLLIAQHFQCKICKINMSRIKHKRRFCIDHDHETKKIRGLLCDPCNSAIGQLQYSVESLHSAIQYIQENSPCR